MVLVELFLGVVLAVDERFVEGAVAFAAERVADEVLVALLVALLVFIISLLFLG